MDSLWWILVPCRLRPCHITVLSATRSRVDESSGGVPQTGVTKAELKEHVVVCWKNFCFSSHLVGIGWIRGTGGTFQEGDLPKRSLKFSLLSTTSISIQHSLVA